MTSPKRTYSNPVAGKPLITTISTGCKTPLMAVKFCNLVRPYYYSNSQTIPRYSVTCIVDPTVDKEFLKSIQTIEKNEGVDTIIKNETEKGDEGHATTGNVLVKFQSKDIIPVYVQNENGESETITLEDELAKDEKIVVIYDILRYTKKNTMKTEHGLSFKPSCIYYYPKGKA